jgi:phage-related protein
MPAALPTRDWILEKNRLDNQTPWAFLFEVDIGAADLPVLRFTNHPTAVVFRKQTYRPYPCAVDEIKEEGGGKQGGVTVWISNVLRETQYLLENNEVRGQRVLMHLVNLSRPEMGSIDWEFVVESWTANAQVAGFVLGKAFDVLSRRFPGRIVTRDLFKALA